MVKRRREEVSDGTIAGKEYYTLFIDTNLDTHLATIISDSATVSDVKNKIILEHSQLFPSSGEVKILSLQVKRQGHFYHLPDSMLVVSAYEGSKRHKSLFVEVSDSEHDTERNSCQPEIKRSSSVREIVDVETALNHAGQSVPTVVEKRQKEVSQDLSETSRSDTNTRSGAAKPSFFEPAAERRLKLFPSEEVSVDNSDSRNGKSVTELESVTGIKCVGEWQDLFASYITSEQLKDDSSLASKKGRMKQEQISSVRLEQTAISESPGGVEVKVSAVDPTSELGINSTPPMKYQSSNMGDITSLIIMGPERDSVGEQTKIAVLNSTTENHVSDNTDKNESMLPQAENDKSNKIEEEKALSANQDPNEKLSECFKPADHCEGEVTNKEGILSPDCLGSNEEMEAANLLLKFKKMKTRKSAARIQDKANMADDLNTVSGISPLVLDIASHIQVTDDNKKREINGHLIETGQTSEIAGDTGLSLEHGSKVILPTGSKPLELGDTNAKINNPVTAVMVSDTQDLKSGSQRKKGRTKKSTAINQVYSCVEQSNTETGLSGLTDTLSNLVGDETMNAQRIPSQKVIQNEEALLPPTGVYQTQESTVDMDETVREAVENNQSRDDNVAACDLPVKGQPNDVQYSELDQSGRHQENDSNINTKEKKKRKNSQITAASNSEINKENVVEELAVSGARTKKIRKSTKGGTVIQSTIPHLEIEKSANIESSCSKPEPAEMDATSSEVPMKGRPETEINDENNLGNAKGKDEGINFRHYFVPGQPQNEVGSSVKVKEAPQSMKPKKKKNKHNAIAESTLESSENHGNGNPSDGRNANGNKIEDSADKQNDDELLAKKETSKSSQDGVKAPTSRDIVAGKKPVEKATKPAVVRGSRAAPALSEGKNGSSTPTGFSSRSKGSEKVVQNASNAKQQSSINHKAASTGKDSSKSARNLLNSSGQKKNLLAAQQKLCAASASSDDENEMVTSDASTHMDTENSTSSGYSSEESKRKGKSNIEDSPDKQNDDELLAKKKTSKASQDGVKAPTSGDIVAGKKPVEKATKPAVARGSRAAPALSDGKDVSSTPTRFSSRSKGSEKVVQNASNAKQQSSLNHNAASTGKGPSESARNLPNSSGQKKNLLTEQQKMCTSRAGSDDENSTSSDYSSDSRADSKRKGKSNIEDSADKLLAKKKTSKVSQDGVKAPTSRDIVAGKKPVEKATKPAVARGSRAAPALSEGKDGSSTPTGFSSRSKGSEKVVQNASNAKQQSSFKHSAASTGKGSSKSVRNLLNNSGQKKNLLTAQRKLCTSSASSDDENEMVTSDASTHMDTENSTTSGYSSEDSKRKGSGNAKMVGGGSGARVADSQKRMSMNKIFKSSNRFKSVKLRSSRIPVGEMDTELDDIVPDSQPNR